MRPLPKDVDFSELPPQVREEVEDWQTLLKNPDQETTAEASAPQNRKVTAARTR
jgi:hypothetical protein